MPPHDDLLGVAISGLAFQLRAPAEVLERSRFDLGGFASSTAPELVIDVRAVGEPQIAAVVPTVSRRGRRWSITALGGFQLEGEGERAQLTYAPHPIDADRARAPLHLLAALKALCALRLAEQGGCLLHASAVALDGRGVAFVGPSGAGKSTVAGMFPEASLLNDELVGIIPGAGGPHVTSTPFSGMLDRPRVGRSVPWVCGLALAHAAEVRLTPLPGREVLRLLAACVVLPEGDAALEARLLDTASSLATGPAWKRLDFPLDAERVTAAIARAVRS